MIRYLVAGLLALLLVSPAAADVRALGTKMSIDDLAATCANGGAGYSIMSDMNSLTCTHENCDHKGGSCSVTCDSDSNCVGTTPSIQVHLEGLAGVVPSALAPPERFGLGHVGKHQLMSACGAARGAIFGSNKSGDHYFCGNAHCDPGIGPCYIECDLSKCIAGMPKKPTGGMTLVAILQGGKGVLHGDQLDGDSSTKSGPERDAPAQPPVIIIP